MNAIPQGELIGAYLDGELTAEERARVERLLAESPECRQLLDDLRAVRESLQSLPRLTLEADFSDKVLREAERRMLTAAPGMTDSAPRRAEPPAARQRTWRLVIVSGLAVAAALVVMFLNRPGFLGEGPVDKGPVAMAPGAAESAREEAPTTRGLVRGEPAAAGRQSQATTHSLAAEGQSGDAMKGKLGLKQAGQRPGIDDLAKDQLDVKVQFAPAAAGGRAGRPSKETHQKTEAPAAGLAVEERVFDNATQLRYGEKALDRSQKGLGGYGGMGGMSGGASMGGAGQAAMGRGGPVAGAATAVPFGSPVDKMGKVATSEKKGTTGEGEALGEPLLIVQCEITPEAARNHALDNVLLKQHVAWGEGPEGVLTEGKPLKALAEKRDRNDDLARRSVQTAGVLGDVNLVYVEAAPEQIRATLAALSNRPDLFMAVAVNPTPGGQFDSFQYYQPQEIAGGQKTGETSSGTVNGALGARRMAKAKVAPAPPAPADGAFRTGGRQGIARRIRLMEELDQRKELEAAKKLENQPQQAKPDLSHYADTPVESKAPQAVPSAPAATPGTNEGKAGEAAPSGPATTLDTNEGKAAEARPEPAASTATGPSVAPTKGQEATAPKTPAVVSSPPTAAKEAPPASSSVNGSQPPSTWAAGQQREYGAQQGRPETMRVLFVVRIVPPAANAAVAMPATRAAAPPAEVHTEKMPAQQAPGEKPAPAVPAAPVKP